MPRTTFGSDYYDRFYFNPRTRVTTREEATRRARTLAALVKHLELPVRRILDAGCGLGWMRRPLLQAFPRATYTGIEVSEHICERYGWTQASIDAYRARCRFDIVICHDVMQYLSDAQAARAIGNFARLCRGALYLHVPTSEDWRRNADHDYSDNAVNLRTTGWYRARLARYFRHAGFGLYVRRGVPLMQWELEKAAVP